MPRGRLAQPLRARAAAARAQERQRARAAGRHRHAGDAAARARLPRGAEGQVAPVEAGRTGATGAPPTRSGSSATTASRSGSRRTPAATPRPRRSAAATPARPTRAGTRTTRARWSAGSGASGPARAVLPRRLAGQPARRARLSRRRTSAAATRPDEFRGLGVPLPPTVDEDLRDEADRPLADEARADRVHRRAARRAAQQRLRQLLRLPAPGRGREDRPAAGGARGPRRPRVAALAHGDRADLRPRRAGPLARRAAPEDVQRATRSRSACRS